MSQETGTDRAAPPVARLPRRVRDVLDALGGDPAVAAVRLGGGRGRRAEFGPGRDWDLVVHTDGAARGPAGELCRRFPAAEAYLADHDPFCQATVELPAGPDGGGDDGDVDDVEVAFVDHRSVGESARRSARGRFVLHPMTRAVVGLPSYVLEAEVALSLPLLGGIAVAGRPDPRLVRAGTEWWRGRAALSLLLARDAVGKGDPHTARLYALGAGYGLAHAVALGRERWYVPSKTFLSDTLDDGLAAAFDRVPEQRTLAELRARTGLCDRAALEFLRAGAERGPGADGA